MSEDRDPPPSGLTHGLRRLLDERSEPRSPEGSQTAVLSLRGANHVVRVIDLSNSGTMIHFAGDIGEGEAVTIQLLDHGPVAGQVRWSKDGRAGINFTAAIDVQARN